MSHSNVSLTRRGFGRVVLGTLVASVMSGCGPEVAQEAVTVAPGGKPSGTPPSKVEFTTTPLPAPSPTPQASRPILRNENVPGFYVRYYRPFEAVDPAQWTLTVAGLVRHPQQWTLTEVMDLPRAAQVSRMKCVECWSAAAKWEGFHFSSVVDLVQPEPTAQWVHIRCADGYYESLTIDALQSERYLFVHHMNDEPLPDLYGAPLRLIAPPLYGYKNAKAIERLEFSEEELVGYWSSVGPYTRDGYIEQGRDHPLDLPGGSREIQGGEVIYDDGIEAQAS